MTACHSVAARRLPRASPRHLSAASRCYVPLVFSLFLLLISLLKATLLSVFHALASLGVAISLPLVGPSLAPSRSLALSPRRHRLALPPTLLRSLSSLLPQLPPSPSPPSALPSADLFSVPLPLPAASPSGCRPACALEAACPSLLVGRSPLSASPLLYVLPLCLLLSCFSLLSAAARVETAEPRRPLHPSIAEALGSVPPVKFVFCVTLSAFLAVAVVASLGRAIRPAEMFRLPPLSRSLFLPAYPSILPLLPLGRTSARGRRIHRHHKSSVHTLPCSPPSALGRRAFTSEAADLSSMASREEGTAPVEAPDSRETRSGLQAEGEGERARRAGVEIPRLLYGTAWKKDNTEKLVKNALFAGFTGIDTACQPKHYDEAGVGRGLQAFLREKSLPRSSLFIQTKFTPIDGQDPRKPLPYDPHAPVSEQVQQSLQTSLANLQVEYLDSVLLHSPMRTAEETLEAWRALEAAVDERRVRLIGLSNCYDVVTLRKLYVAARHKPRLLQNRFYADTGYDKEIREFCDGHGVVYEAFWTLTANPHMLRSAAVRSAATRFNCTPAQAWFRYLLEKGIVVLTGTTSEQHMREDLEVLSLDFSRQSFEAIDREVELYA
ncbi:aldo/keto reductase family oxidoreductase [Besnoitia besnoiti]|uniref:Aldo/keto reductase family oxidoreductase n=1 Tax=Besnoitia besnoiti TaxID=94643 RepID=A0A2A9M761_BESBE|nr:aldo/keto reductase family oxidoreductase [Besnoitia besnoiti]PFH31240.1 aldo/keto reductase family oxidoreductase [Besnoitia besnoiti]